MYYVTKLFFFFSNYIRCSILVILPHRGYGLQTHMYHMQTHPDSEQLPVGHRNICSIWGFETCGTQHRQPIIQQLRQRIHFLKFFIVITSFLLRTAFYTTLHYFRYVFDQIHCKLYTYYIPTLQRISFYTSICIVAV